MQHGYWLIAVIKLILDPQEGVAIDFMKEHLRTMLTDLGQDPEWTQNSGQSVRLEKCPAKLVGNKISKCIFI